MNILVTGVTEPVELTASWRRKHDVAFASLDGLISGIRESPQTGQRADVIVTSVAHRIEYTGDTFEFVESPLEFVVRVAQDLRKLPSNVAMTDGRKWNSLPFIAVLSAALIDTQIPQSLDISVLMERPRPELTLTEIERIFQEYRERLLDELDNLGLLVSYDHGRYRVGPALTPRERQAEGAFYYGPADQSGSRVGKYYTVDRDVYGIQYEVEKFEALINTPKVSERQLQEFFVEHPHFLVATRLLQALPHVPLKDSSGKLLIPDFVLKPIVAAQRDSNWEILDLKLPQAKLLAGPRDHGRFSRDVLPAITQVKDYKDYFGDPANSETIRRTLGHRLRHPRLGVLIGRLPSSEYEVELLEKQQSREPGVKVVTYDEVLDTQKKLLR